MRSKADFESLVYQKAEELSTNNYRQTRYRKIAFNTAAVITVLTAVAVGSAAAINGLNSAESSVSVTDGISNTGAAADNNVDNGAYGVPENKTEDIEEVYSPDENFTKESESEEDDADSFDGDVAEEEFDTAKGLSRDEIYEGLPVKINYYWNEDYENENKTLLKTITDENDVNDILERLESAESVEAKNQTDTASAAILEILREDKEHMIEYRKVYFIQSDWVCVNESGVPFGDDVEYSGERYISGAYSFAMTDEFLQIIRDYFDENFMTE